VLNTDSHAAQIHRKVVLKIQPAFPGGGFYFLQVGRIQGFQNPVIQMEPVQAHPDSFIEKFKGAHLPGPG